MLNAGDVVDLWINPGMHSVTIIADATGIYTHMEVYNEG